MFNKSLSSNTNEYELELKNYKPGFYMIIVNDLFGKVQFKKLIIIK